MNIKRVIFGLVIIVILSFIGYLGYQEYLAPVESTPTLSAIETAVITINAEGRVVPFSHLAHAFEIPGQVSAIQVKEGDQVNYDDVLLSLDKEVLQTQVTQAKAALKAAQAQREMLPKQASDEQKDQAKAQIEQARAVLEAAQLQVKKADLTAFLAGLVVSVEVEEGQVVGAGMPVIIIADTSFWKVETLDLLEEDVVNVRVGMPAEVKFAAYPDRVIQGRVDQIAHNASSYQGNVTYQVTIVLFSTEDLDLAWGMTSFVEIDPSKAVIPPRNTATPLPAQTITPTTDQIPSETPKPEETKASNEERKPSSYTV
ncbi:efflux RND transporter periplasmic adaptor subunit, partial [bacterium]|nr:efflux RND transporter periplasmic adaptor subunit [bacterium]